MYKKVIAFVITLTMLFSMTAYAKDNDTVDTTDVDTLSKLKIIKGTGDGYDLDGQITRSQAAAIVVRILGEEDNMTKPKISYYSDVEPDKWYAPYIMFIANKGIINGYSDYTFRPDEYISEKSVIKMVLGILGYKYILDYDLDNIYEKAYEFGLTQDETYKTRKEDNKEYPRREAFSLIKQALGTKLKNSEKTLVQTWIEDERFTKAEISNAGLDADELKTDVSKIVTTNSSNVTITFNEQVKGITKDNVEIVEKDKDNKLSVSKVTIKDKVVKLVTSSQRELKDYVITFKNIEDNDGYITENLTAEFKGYKSDVIESNKFLISKIESLSKNTIKVYFTQPIGTIPILPNYYSIYEGDSLWLDGDQNNMYIVKLPDSDRGVMIKLKNKVFSIKEMYELKIDGTMVDKTGAKLNDGEGDSMVFPPLVIDSPELEREMTYAFNKGVVTIEFNKDLDKETAEKGTNYQVLDTNNRLIQSMPKLDPSNSKRVLLRIIGETLDPRSNYKLHISGVKDLERVNTFSEANIIFEVVDESPDEEKLEISLVEPVSNSELRVYFNKNLNADSNNAVLSRFALSSQPFNNVFFDKDNPNMVYLYLDSSNKMTGGNTYTVTASGLQDELGLSYNDMSYSFTAVGNDKESPTISSGYILGQRSIKIEFNKPISNSNGVYNMYKIKYTNNYDETKYITPKSATVFDYKYVVLTMDEDLEYSRTYKVEYQLIRDFREDSFSGGSSRDYILDFAY